MATVNCGILDGFMGKVGTVVGSFWKGIPVMRAYTRNRHDARTESQLMLRKRFAALSELSSGFYQATLVGMHKVAVERSLTEGNVFMEVNFDKVSATGTGTLNVDYTGLKVALGRLTGVHFDVPQFDTPQQVKVDFSANTECVGTHADDEVYVFVYCPDAKCGVLSEAVKRSEETTTVRVPSYWNGMKVHVWGFAVGAKVNERPFEPSESSYIGSGNIG